MDGYSTPPGRSTSHDEHGPMPQCFQAVADATSSRRKYRVLAYGDSLTAGFYSHGLRFSPYGKTLVQRLGAHLDLEIWVCGLSGEYVREMASRADDDEIEDCMGRVGKGIRCSLKEHGPFDVALIMAGTNDLGCTEAAEIVSSIEQLHTICHEAGVQTVALAMPPSAVSSDTGSLRGRWMDVNSRLEEWACKSEMSFFIATDKLVPFSRESELWERDGLHLSNLGSEKLGEGLCPLILPLLEAVRSPVEIAAGKDSPPQQEGSDTVPSDMAAFPDV